MTTDHVWEQLIAERGSNPSSEALPYDSPVLIYGAGNLGKEMYRVLSEKGYRICAFLDRRAKPGDEWHGVPIRSSQSIEPEWRLNYVVVIAIFNRETAIAPIVQGLNDEGYSHIVSFMGVYDSIAEELGDRFWLARKSSLSQHAAQINACDALWEDEKSRVIFRSTLKFRLSGAESDSASPVPEEQYFPVDIPSWESPLRFVDCGAFDGDTLAIATGFSSSVGAVAAFECDPVSYEKLVKYVRGNRASLPAETVLFPCALWSHTTTLSFSGGGLESSSLTAGPGHSATCVALDQAITFFHPNLIKMDIEGAEVEALWGARRLIQENKPGLAICVYHRPTHLWQIPLLLQSWNLNYRFYLRSHAYNCFDTVLYALPR